MLRIITHINKFMDHNILIVKKLFISRILVTLSYELPYRKQKRQ